MSTSTTLEQAVKKQKESNDKYIKAFKKASGVKKQTTIPSAAAQHTEWAIKEDWSMQDAISWRSLCEKAKYARMDAEGSAIFATVFDTIDLAAHCGTHPVGLIHFARTSFGLKTWDMDSIEFLKDNLLVDDEDKDNVVEVDKDDLEDEPPGWQERKRKFGHAYDASQPYPTDEEIEEINQANMAAGDVNF